MYELIIIEYDRKMALHLGLMEFAWKMCKEDFDRDKRVGKLLCVSGARICD